MFNLLLITADSLGQWFLISLNTIAILIMILKYLRDGKKDKQLNDNEIFQEKLAQEKNAFQKAFKKKIDFTRLLDE